MAENGGKRPGAGRPKGTKGKKTIEVEEMMAKHNCDPIEAMIRLAKMAEEDAQAEDTPKDRLPHYQFAGQMHKELASYRYPKRKAIELSGDLNVTSHEDSLEDLK